jgi:hypothetical protein
MTMRRWQRGQSRMNTTRIGCARRLSDSLADCRERGRHVAYGVRPGFAAPRPIAGADSAEAGGLRLDGLRI